MPSGSFERGGSPRSVPDPDAERHREAGRRQRAYNDEQERRAGAVARERAGIRLPDVGHPSALESMIPVWGAGREALADAHDGNYVQAAGNLAMAVTDVVPAKAALTGLAKGAFKVGGTHVWRNRIWEEENTRQWLGRKGHLKPGEHGHHWLIPQNGWGRHVPDAIKNQPWNNYGREPVVHGRIHGRYTVDGQKLPRYGPAERVIKGTPPWAGAATVTTPAGGMRANEAGQRKPASR